MHITLYTACFSVYHVFSLTWDCIWLFQPAVVNHCVMENHPFIVWQFHLLKASILTGDVPAARHVWWYHMVEPVLTGRQILSQYQYMPLVLMFLFFQNLALTSIFTILTWLQVPTLNPFLVYISTIISHNLANINQHIHSVHRFFQRCFKQIGI